MSTKLRTSFKKKLGFGKRNSSPQTNATGSTSDQPDEPQGMNIHVLYTYACNCVLFFTILLC